MVKKKVAISCINTKEDSYLYKYSTFIKLQRVIGYCLQMNGKYRKEHQGNSLTIEELERARNAIIRKVQMDSFLQELKDLQKKGIIDTKSPLQQLNPFIDQDGLIRVEGRLTHAEIPRTQQHPVVLPAKHHITTIIMRDEHIRLKHCGQQQLLCSIRMDYWPLAGIREARKITRRCVKCFKVKPTIPTAIMGDLPKQRVTKTSRPFDICGIDYAGPLKVRENKRRGNIPISKAYICVFICFQTNAIHLELVSSMNTEAFMTALKRFFARRGVSSHIYSDNGGNFIAASKELKTIYEFMKENHKQIKDELVNQKVNWHFIPPHSLNFGGLWESAVKSCKRHLMTVTQGLIYTFEEYYTLLVEIEGVLNSRPLVPVSSDPNDYTALTPAHFLLGDSLTRIAEVDYLDCPDTRLSRWQHIQKLRQHFWKRWHREYLQQLQTRTR